MQREAIRKDSIRILFGNEPIPTASDDTPQDSAATDPAVAVRTLRIDWIDNSRFIVRDLRKVAGDRSADAALRVFGQTFDGRWIESAFPFGGGLRRYFDPHDAVLYLALTDRVRDGDPKNTTPLARVDREIKPLDDWAGGDARGLGDLFRARYFSRLGVNCVVASPPYRQTEGVMLADFPPHADAPRPVAPYRGVWTRSFGARYSRKSEPSRSTPLP